MKYFTSIGFLLFACLSFTAAQQIDTRHLSLELQFDWDNRQAYGTAEITATVKEETDSILLDAGNLSIQAVACNGRETFFRYDGGDADKNLAIKLDRRYKPGELFIIRIQYRTLHENRADPNAIGGSFGKGLRFQRPTSATPAKRKQVWSSGEPANNKYWFPCNEDIADVHTTEISARVEKPLMVISNGNLVSTKDHADNTRTFHYRSTAAFPNYLVSIVVGEYTDVAQKSGAVTIHQYGYPDEKEAVKATVELLPAMLKFLEEKTGYKYPYAHYSQVVVQDYPFPGLVGQHMAAVLSDNYIDDYGVHKDFKYLWDGVAMQALANQWFGNLIMPASWKDCWLNNAFAQYFAGLFTAETNGKDEYLTYYQPFEKSNVLGDWSAGNRHPIVPKEVADINVFTTDSYSKFRGALVLRMLQQEMGDELWWKTIRLYVSTNAGRQVSTADFQKAAEKAAGKSYQWFFDQWIYTTGLPQLEVTKDYDAVKKQLVIKVKQVNVAGEDTTGKTTRYFKGKTGIEIGGEVKTVFLAEQEESLFIFPLAKKPAFVHFNVDDNFLSEIIFKKTVAEYFSQLAFSRDVLARQEAIDKLVLIAKDSATTAALKDSIVTALRREVHSGRYWRYRWYALGALQRVVTAPYDRKMIVFLTGLIGKEKAWIKATAISMLGRMNSPVYESIYIKAMRDESDRVINAAAIALGKTRSGRAYGRLMELEKEHSWKNQNRISALNGLQQLGDEKAAGYVLQCLEDNRSPRWYLGTPVWDYPFAAVNTLVALGKAAAGYEILLSRLKQSLADDDINDIFQQVQLINLLKVKKAEEVYVLLKEKYKNDLVILDAVLGYEKQYLESIAE